MKTIFLLGIAALALSACSGNPSQNPVGPYVASEPVVELTMTSDGELDQGGYAAGSELARAYGDGAGVTFVDYSVELKPGDKVPFRAYRIGNPASGTVAMAVIQSALMRTGTGPYADDATLRDAYVCARVPGCINFTKGERIVVLGTIVKRDGADYVPAVSIDVLGRIRTNLVSIDADQKVQWKPNDIFLAVGGKPAG